MNKHEFRQLLQTVRDMAGDRAKIEAIADIMQRDNDKAHAQSQAVVAHKMKIMLDSICDKAVEHLETHGYQRV